MVRGVADAGSPAHRTGPAGGGPYAPPLGDRYDLGEVLGRGGVATVYRAHDRMLGREVAVKVLPAVAHVSDDLLRHQGELRMLARLRHPGLVTLLDGGVAPVGELLQAYLVMELVGGPSLARRLTDGPLSDRETARLGRTVAEALAYVHSHDVIHRDIKPGNILLLNDRCLDEDGDDDLPAVKLADFGIARLSAATHLTMTGAIIGTASYLSPEQAVGAALRPSSDVYALGLVLLECLTGRPAYSGTLAEVASARLSKDPEVPAQLSRPLADLVVDMTRREPDSRPSAADVAEVLQDVLSRQGGGTADPAPTLYLPPGDVHVRPEPASSDAATTLDHTPRRVGLRRSRVLAGAVLVVALVVGALAVRGVAADRTTDTPPVYPTVVGPLGDSLRELQRSVEP